MQRIPVGAETGGTSALLLQLMGQQAVVQDMHPPGHQ